MKKGFFLAVAFLLTAASISAYSHSGGTDRYGCHYDRKTGIYHCH